MSTAASSLKRNGKCGGEPSRAKSHQCFYVVLIERGKEEKEEKSKKRTKAKGGKVRESKTGNAKKKKKKGGLEAGLFPPSQSLKLLRGFSQVGKFLLMTQLCKWKCCSAWLMSLSLTPNGKNPTTRAIFWTLHFFHPNSRGTLRHTLRKLLSLNLTPTCSSFPPSTYTFRQHRHIFCISSWLPYSLNLSLFFFSLPFCFQIPQVTLSGSCQWSSWSTKSIRANKAG